MVKQSSTEFDPREAARFEAALAAAGIRPTIFPLTIEGLPAVKWGSLEPGECVPASDVRQGYGIACGHKSAGPGGIGLVCLDVDAKNADGFASLARLEREWGPLPERTLSVSSPHGGGVHLYFVHPGEFQSNAGKIAPGLDVRAEGGFVRIPGSPHKKGGVYRVDDPTPPALLPGSWADRLPRYRGGSSGDPVPVEALSLDPDELRRRLSETAKGKRGPVWAAWRKIAAGERFVRIPGSKAGGEPIPDGYGGVDEWIVKGLLASLVQSEGEWYRVPGEDFAALVEPSFSILRADVAALGQTSKYTPDVLAKKWNSATEWARRRLAEKDKAAALADRLRAAIESEERGEWPWIVVQSGSYYVRRGALPIAYRGPKVRADLWTTAREEWKDGGPDVYKPGKSGPMRMGVDDLLERYGYPVDEVHHALHEREPRIEDRILVLPGPPIVAKPRRHPEIGSWLAALGGPALLDWIAVLTDLTYAAPALWITGAGGVGKSLLAVGLAKVWGASPTPMSRAFAEFNDSILTCPLVFGDEEVPRGRDGRPDVEALKRLITETRRKINEKHKPVRDVTGAVRVIMASNNTNLIRTAADLTAEDAAALAERFVHIHVEPSDAATIRRLLPSDGTIQRDWIDGGWIAEHALWLASTREVPMGPRLRMSPDSERLRRMLVTQPGAGFLVCQAIYDWTLNAARATVKGSPPKDAEIIWSEGTVLATATAVANRIPEDSKRHSRKQIGQTLRRFSSGAKTVRDPNGVPRKFWAIDLENIRVWAEEEGWGDPAELDKAVAILNGKTEGV